MAIEMRDRTYTAWAEAFTIFAKYEPDVFGQVSASHDIIYAGPKPYDISAEDKKRLEELGWHEDYTHECFYHFT